VHKGKAVVGVTVCTQRRLGDPASLNLLGGGVVTHVALEEGFPHLGNDV